MLTDKERCAAWEELAIAIRGERQYNVSYRSSLSNQSVSSYAV